MTSWTKLSKAEQQRWALNHLLDADREGLLCYSCRDDACALASFDSPGDSHYGHSATDARPFVEKLLGRHVVHKLEVLHDCGKRTEFIEAIQHRIAELEES